MQFIGYCFHAKYLQTHPQIQRVHRNPDILLLFVQLAIINK